MKLGYKLLFLLVVVLFTGCATTNSSWMQDNSQYLNNKTIGELSLTGSHFANAYNIESSNTLCIGEAIESNNMSANAALMQQLISNQDFNTQTFMDYVNTQNQDITSQLNNGVRFLELQVCKQNNIFYTSNVYLGTRFSDVISQIKHFAANNPDEIIIIDLDNNLWAPYGAMNDTDTTTISNYLVSELGNSLVPQSMRYNTIGDMKSAGKQIIILSSNSRLINNPLIWDKNQVTVTAPVEYSTIKKLLAIEEALLLPENAHTISIIPFYSAIHTSTLKTDPNVTLNTDDNDVIIINYLTDALDKHAIVVVTDWRHQKILTNITINDNLPSNTN